MDVGAPEEPHAAADAIAGADSVRAGIDGEAVPWPGGEAGACVESLEASQVVADAIAGADSVRAGIDGEAALRPGGEAGACVEAPEAPQVVADATTGADSGGSGAPTLRPEGEAGTDVDALNAPQAAVDAAAGADSAGAGIDGEAARRSGCEAGTDVDASDAPHAAAGAALAGAGGDRAGSDGEAVGSAAAGAGAAMGGAPAAKRGAARRAAEAEWAGDAAAEGGAKSADRSGDRPSALPAAARSPPEPAPPRPQTAPCAALAVAPCRPPSRSAAPSGAAGGGETPFAPHAALRPAIPSTAAWFGRRSASSSRGRPAAPCTASRRAGACVACPSTPSKELAVGRGASLARGPSAAARFGVLRAAASTTSLAAGAPERCVFARGSPFPASSAMSCRGEPHGIPAIAAFARSAGAVPGRDRPSAPCNAFRRARPSAACRSTAVVGEGGVPSAAAPFASCRVGVCLAFLTADAPGRRGGVRRLRAPAASPGRHAADGGGGAHAPPRAARRRSAQAVPPRGTPWPSGRAGQGCLPDADFGELVKGDYARRNAYVTGDMQVGLMSCSAAIAHAPGGQGGGEIVDQLMAEAAQARQRLVGCFV